MNTTNVCYKHGNSLSLTTVKAWVVALAFVAGNVVFPQLAHLIPQGGLILLPIYFFTLFGAYKYGMQVGVLTAVASPLVNHALFGMPAATMLPIIMLKGVLLAVAAAYAARRWRASLLTLAGVVLAYQVVGCAVECLAYGSLTVGLQDFRIGFPGMMIQVLGGWALLRRDYTK